MTTAKLNVIYYLRKSKRMTKRKFLCVMLKGMNYRMQMSY
ncbi:hypothetical protein SRABI96_03386 [Peribacillus sp. Bi96]|nr:hypothetical protein SRABI96_03386 [Peribacillus sp. Bi96]